jgi:hypothetical protein
LTDELQLFIERNAGPSNTAYSRQTRSPAMDLVVLPIDTSHAVRRKNPRFDPLGDFAYVSEGHNRSFEASRGCDSNKLLLMKKGGGARTLGQKERNVETANLLFCYGRTGR